MAEMKYTVKDSVFTYLFKQPEYARKLYLALHPEDTNVTEADCKLVTLENILTTGMYNDVGLQVSGHCAARQSISHPANAALFSQN